MGNLKERLRNAAAAHITLPRSRKRYEALAGEWRREFPEPTFDQLQSQLATHAQIWSPQYDRWRRELRVRDIRHRKYWEYAFIMEALEQRGMFAAGKRALGFGVGKEPIASYLATRGVDVLATDLTSERAASEGWRDTNEYASTFDELNAFGVCDPEVFRRHVTFRSVDMNAIPPDLRGFDCAWSSCAFEHLGSIERGLAFVENSIATLRSGGVAVHTTEFNLSSNDETVDNDSTVIFRRRDLEALKERLKSRGHRVEPLNFNPGVGELDAHIDVPPYTEHNHIKLLIERFVTTSFGIIVTAA